MADSSSQKQRSSPFDKDRQSPSNFNTSGHSCKEVKPSDFGGSSNSIIKLAKATKQHQQYQQQLQLQQIQKQQNIMQAIRQSNRQQGLSSTRTSTSGSLGRDSSSTSYDAQNPYPLYARTTFFYLNQTSRPRSWCIRIVSNKYPNHSTDMRRLRFK